jgi:enhancing lycopene biosynthesis protein 2
MSKVALILSGCGVFDGSEVHEAVSALVHLSRHGAQVSCFAPDVQFEAVNHLTHKPSGEKRNALVEAARIARGKIQPLSALKAADFDAVVFPGGFGAAKNLCNFASKGAECEVNPDVARIVKQFHDASKPVGMCCIAPVIGARVLGTKSGGPGVSVTIGSDSGTAAAIAAMGSRNVSKPVTEAHTDEKHNLVTTPAYMYGDAAVHEVFDGIGAMIEGVMARVGVGVRG